MTLPLSSEKRLREIALLFALPVNREEFISRVSKSDYLRKFDSSNDKTAKRDANLESAWEKKYCPGVADYFGELMAAAIRLGIDVRTQATLATLREVTAERSVVILFTHWKGPEIVNDDLVAPREISAFVERIRDHHTPLSHWLLERFHDIGHGGASANGPARRRRFWPFNFTSHRDQSLLGILNESLSVQLSEHMSAVDGVNEVIEHEVTRAARRRDILDTLFGRLLRPGNRLELFDGLQAKEVVEAAIAPDFQGVLDLTTCTSTVLADFIAACRHLRLRTVQFPTTQDPLWATKYVKTTIELVAAAGLSYLEARNLARRKLEQALFEVERSKS
jgi:hypothetical protein